MSTYYNRRQIMALGLGAGISAFGLGACDTPTPSSPAGPISLNMVFWGSATRDKFTKQATELFHQSHPTTTITSQVNANFTDYWTKLNTLIANGNTPDLIQMDMRYVSQYVRKRTLLDLTSFIYNQTIDLTDFDPMLLDSSKVNKTIYGIPLGGNYQTYLYDKTAIQLADIGPIPSNMTWDMFKTYTTELTKALGNGTYGTADLSGDITSFEVWIRQRGKELYDQNGKVKFDLTDAGDWYNYWDGMRKANACLPMSVQSKVDITGNPGDSSLTKKLVVFSSLYSNQLEAFQAATTHQLALTLPPLGSAPGMYLKTSMMLSIAETTKYPTECANFANFLINDAGAVKAIGIERGVPGSVKARALLNPHLNETQQAIMTYINLVSESGLTRPKEVLDPPGAGTVATTLKTVSQDIGLGRISVSGGAKELYTSAQKAVMSS